jgi:hypothetical protein
VQKVVIVQIEKNSSILFFKAVIAVIPTKKQLERASLWAAVENLPI